jgi:hypothetical protein
VARGERRAGGGGDVKEQLEALLGKEVDLEFTIYEPCYLHVSITGQLRKASLGIPKGAYSIRGDGLWAYVFFDVRAIDTIVADEETTQINLRYPSHVEVTT